MKKRITCLLTLSLVAVLVLGAFSTVAAQKTLKVGLSAPPRTMDPHGSDSDSNLSIMSNIFNGLLQRNTDGELKPALATSWERKSMNVWRFNLRKGVKFHNGNKFTWEDVKYTMKRLNNPQVSEFINFGAKIESVTKVDGDPWTIDITTTEPIPYFVQNLHQVYIVDKESTESRSQGEVGTQPIGTGPYKFVEWVKGSYLRVEANKNYWGETPDVKKAEFRAITEPSTRLATINSGEIDVLQGVPVTFVDSIENNPQVKMITRQSRRSIFLSLANDKDLPTSNIKVRKAIYKAINEKEIINKVMFGHASPAAQIPDPPTTGYSDKIERLSYDPERAKELLDEAGYPDGFSITLSAPNNKLLLQ